MRKQVTEWEVSKANINTARWGKISYRTWCERIGAGMKADTEIVAVGNKIALFRTDPLETV